jgi:DnaJ domain
LGTKSQNHYEVLGLWRDAGEAEIRRAYRRLAMLNHPDVSSNPGAEERFRALKEAFDVLSDPAARARFDATLGIGVRFEPSRARSNRGATAPGGWAPPWEQDWKAEAWLKANAGPAPWSVRTLAGEVRGSWRTLTIFLSSLAFMIVVCALLDRAFPDLGTAVVVTVFTLPFFAYPLFVLRWVQGPNEVFSRDRRRRSSTPADSTTDAERKPR